jgi:DNA-binding transcriptional MocR family regulator
MANFKYRKIVDDIIQAITLGTLQHKLDSVRDYAKIKGVGVSTVTQAYHELQRLGWIHAQPKRGYFVSHQQSVKQAITHAQQQPDYGKNYNRIQAGQDLARAVQYSFNDPDILPLSCTAPSTVIDNELILIRLHKQVLKHRPYKLQMQDPIEGLLALRQQICRHLLRSGQVLSPRQVLIINGRQEGLLLALTAAKGQHQTIAASSPLSFYFQSMLSQLASDVIEVPIQANYDDELALLSAAYNTQPFDSYLIDPNFADPTGRELTPANKLALISWATDHKVTLIEYDRSEFYFATQRPVTLGALAAEQVNKNPHLSDCKVISIGDFYDTVSTSISLGYLLCINTLDACLFTRQTIAEEPGLTRQHIITNLLSSGQYQQILNKLRAQLRSNYLQTQHLLRATLADKIYISQPDGGPTLWLKLPEGYSSETLWHRVIAAKLSIAPGSMFSLSQQYDCFFRITFGLPWNEKMQAGISTLAQVIDEYIQS